MKCWAPSHYVNGHENLVIAGSIVQDTATIDNRAKEEGACICWLEFRSIYERQRERMTRSKM